MNEDLESRLRDALRARADRTPIAGDGLERIRARTARRRMGRVQPAIAALSLTALVVAGVATAAGHNHGHRNNDVVLPAGGATHSPTPGPTASPTATATPAGWPAESGCSVPNENPALLVGHTCKTTSTAIPKDTGGEYLAITSPASGVTVGRDVTVSGKARVFEAQFTVDVTQNGTVVQTAHLTASAGAPSLGTWSTVFHLAPGNYRIEAYELSAKGDGSKSATDTIWITVR
jgi:Immunoglobulin-like domain of bacterial spore germination